VKLISFRQQDIGVPVYAALDGTVVEVQDGEPDRVLVANNTSRGNFVTLDHGGTHKTLYFHMRTAAWPWCSDNT
jgi:murein DD-endopeptidase MepM/ murein hydrolase activator NlpD